MNKTIVGMGVGTVLALTWVAFGFWAFVFVLVAMLIGAVIGWMLEGRVDVHALADAFRGKRSS